MFKLQPRRWFMPGLLAVATLVGLATASPAANVAIGKTAFADVNLSTAKNVNDNSLTTEWNTANSTTAPNNFVGIDLGSDMSLKFARIYWNANQPRGFTIEVATTVDLTDPDTNFNYGQGDWQTAYFRSSADDQPGSPDLIELASPAPPAGHTGYRYIRILGTEGPSDTAKDWGVREFQVLDAPLPTVSGTTKTASGPLANAVVQLTGPSGAATVSSQSVLSDANGKFTFTGLDAGTYSLRGLAPGRYAPVTASVTVAEANVTQDLTFSTAAQNSTAALPAYGLDFIATPAKPGDQNAQTNGNALPADQLPPGGQVWTTNTALPTGGVIGDEMPGTLKFFFPPTADGKSNVINAANATIPFAAAHYTAIYLLQVAGDQPAYTTATLNYADGTSSVVTTGSGSNVYAFNIGTDKPGEDAVTAFTVDHTLTPSGPQAGDFNVYMRAIPVDSGKVLKSLSFGTYINGPGSGFQSRGLILGYSADSTDAPAALGSIAGKVKYGASPVQGAIVRYLSYRATTDATGAYKFSSVPAGTWQVSANKAANYPMTSINVPVTAGQDVTNADIIFANPIPVVAEQLSNPQTDAVSTDENMADAGPSAYQMGREYIPTGLYSPSTVPDPAPSEDPAYGGLPLWESSKAVGVPTALPFDFGDIKDTPILVGDPGYPEGGTPNSVVAQGATFIAPVGVKIYNAYFTETGVNGPVQVAPILRYTDGTSEQKVLNVSDWFGTASSDELPYLVMHGRHWVGDGPVDWNQKANIKINVLVVPVDSTKTLKEIFFPKASNPSIYPTIYNVSWEVDQLPPAASDLQVVVKKSDNTPAARAMVSAGPYNAYTDADGVAVFHGMPANLNVDISAYISGVTRAATKAGHVVATGKKLPTADTVNLTLPADAPVFSPLQIAYDYDVIADTSNPGDYKGAPVNDWGFVAEELPPSTGETGQFVVSANVPYIMPMKTPGYSNVLRVNGQKINVAPGNYSSIDFVSTGMGAGDLTLTYATLYYSDGTSDNIQIASADWVKDWDNFPATNQWLFFRQIGVNTFATHDRRWGGRDDAGTQAAFLPQIIPVNANKTLTGFSFPPIPGGFESNDFSLLAITLEGQAAPTSGTITGKVVGKPAGAAASGPIERAMVKWDEGHAIYTDASGNFTLTNVPLGAANLTVTAEGSGILTKTFPVTVTANTNAGTLDVGAAAEQVSIVLGATNVSNGITQLEGAPIPYVKDGGKPDFKYTIPDSGTRVVTVAGKTARETADNGSYIYFKVDKGWIQRGRMGSIGYNPSTWSVDPSGDFQGRLAPHIWMKVTYLDRGTDSWNVHFTEMSGMVNSATNNPTYSMSSPYSSVGVWDGKPADANGNFGVQEAVITKTNTNTWKTAVLEFNPIPDEHGVSNLFGAYASQNLEADFRLAARGGSDNPAEVFSEVVLSTTPIVVPGANTARALQIAGGLAEPTSADITALDVTGPSGAKDGKITILDALALARPS